MNIISFFRKQVRRIIRNNLDGYLKIEGWLTPYEAIGLYRIAAKLSRNASVVEIGSWKGKSTWCIAKGLKKGTINCIDPFNAAGDQGSKELYKTLKGENDLLTQFKENLKNVSSSVKINILKGYSSEFTGSVKNIDLLFIDGDHSIEGCKFDYENFHEEIKPNGFLAFHDYFPDRKDSGPTWVIENLVNHNPAFIHYENFNSLCVFQKQAKAISGSNF